MLTAAVGLVVPLVLGAVSLRVTGIAFAMVTLAFAQAGNVLVHKNLDNLTGGDEGLDRLRRRHPERVHRRLQHEAPVLARARLCGGRLRRLRLGGLVLARARLAGDPGNELRVQVLGLRPFWFKLTVFVLASFLATAGGVVYLLLVGSSSPGVTTASFTLAL